MDIIPAILLLITMFLTFHGLYLVYKKYNKTLEPLRIKEKSIKITSFKVYLKGKDISFFNTLNLPRWAYFLIPIGISYRSSTSEFNLLGFILLELLFLVFLYISYVFAKRKNG